MRIPNIKLCHTPAFFSKKYFITEEESLTVKLKVLENFYIALGYSEIFIVYDILSLE